MYKTLHVNSFPFSCEGMKSMTCMELKRKVMIVFHVNLTRTKCSCDLEEKKKEISYAYW